MTPHPLAQEAAERILGAAKFMGKAGITQADLERQIHTAAVQPIIEKVDEQTKLVAIASCHFISGWRVELEAMEDYLSDALKSWRDLKAGCGEAKEKSL